MPCLGIEGSCGGPEKQFGHFSKINLFNNPQLKISSACTLVMHLYVTYCDPFLNALAAENVSAAQADNAMLSCAMEFFEANQTISTIFFIVFSSSY